jgi:hypothetical protein
MINISLPIYTTEIIINEKRLFNIPDILKFTKLIKLDVSKCSLTQLPILPKQLIEINCSYNKIISLPEFNQYLQKIDCNHNCLENIPEFNENLIKID